VRAAKEDDRADGCRRSSVDRDGSRCLRLRRPFLKCLAHVVDHGLHLLRDRRNRHMAVTIRSSMIAIAALLATGYVGRAQTQGAPERFTAMAVNMNRGGSGTVEIVINRWSTDSERNRLSFVFLQPPSWKTEDVCSPVGTSGRRAFATTSDH